MFNGKIVGLKLAKELGVAVEEIPTSWYEKAKVLKAHPGEIKEEKITTQTEGVFPVIHCVQEIPCNPCSTVCPTNSINLEGDPIMGYPNFEGSCIGCGKCVTICPGLAITLVDFRKDKEYPIVTLPYEISNKKLNVGGRINCNDIDGNMLGSFEVISILDVKANNRTQIIKIKAPKELAAKIVSFVVQDKAVSEAVPTIIIETINDDAMVCLCERVTAGEVRKLIREGIHDMNQIKVITRAGMGACGYKTCENLMKQLFIEEGISLEEVELNTRRPLYVEVPLGKFAEGDN
ncbi:MAG: (2Fe-2S)-binding protein, partial [Candidatus Cloacimonetes bacterium]|nr:(2Fe-2S)-binding protein [Candidatus Cloacimonadota bacterium]